MQSLWEQMLELERFEKQAERELKNQFDTIIREKEELFSFLKTWENAIGKENIAKITYRRK